MEKYKIFTGIAAPLPMMNVDTDMIIPKQFLKTIKRSGLGKNLFYELRYDLQGNIKNDFVLNWDPYKSANILITGENFGCGSSREHAPWSLLDFSFQCIIAPSFADIFYGNCFKNGILPISLDKVIVDQVFIKVEREVGYEITVNLEKQKIYDDLEIASFEIDSFKKSCLIDGLDDIGLTLKNKVDIKNFEKSYQESFPWLNDGES